MRIFDTIIFYNELELLKIRLNVLNPYVDCFVIVESHKTFTGKEKPLFYYDNKDMFKEFNHKIIHIVTDFVGNYGWANEASQRNEIRRGLSGAHKDDIIMISDLDEIPNLKHFDFSSILPGEIVGFNQQYYYYYLNVKMHLTQHITKAFRMEMLDKFSPQDIRGQINREWNDMGWHFSFLGDTKFIINKINSFSHQDMNLPEYVDPVELQRRIDENKDLFDRSYGFEDVKIDSAYPQYIIDNQDKLKHLIKQ